MSEPSKLNVVLLGYEKKNTAMVVALVLAANERFYPDDDEQLSALLREMISDLNVSDLVTFQKALKLQSHAIISEGKTDYHAAVQEAMSRKGILVMPDNQFDSNGKAQCFAVWLAS